MFRNGSSRLFGQDLGFHRRSLEPRSIPYFLADFTPPRELIPRIYVCISVGYATSCLVDDSSLASDAPSLYEYGVYSRPARMRPARLKSRRACAVSFSACRSRPGGFSVFTPILKAATKDDGRLKYVEAPVPLRRYASICISLAIWLAHFLPIAMSFFFCCFGSFFCGSTDDSALIMCFVRAVATDDSSLITCFVRAIATGRSSRFALCALHWLFLFSR